ncbi:hypothetical protein VNO77_28865 [Canavalia gladiata]|uniref:Uncharacterized protein n=1 Tax=Canavalia gladiata TaxID=3824 RepID=A0AAN9Q7Z6_CANGL
MLIWSVNKRFRIFFVQEHLDLNELSTYRSNSRVTSKQALALSMKYCLCCHEIGHMLGGEDRYDLSQLVACHIEKTTKNA